MICIQKIVLFVICRCCLLSVVVCRLSLFVVVCLSLFVVYCCFLFVRSPGCPGGPGGPGCQCGPCGQGCLGGPGGPCGPGGQGCLGSQGCPGDQVCQCIWFTWSKQSDYRKNLRCHCVYFCSLVIFILSKTVSYPEWSVCQGPCRELKPCVECQAFGSGQLKEVNSKHLLLPIFTCTADPVSQRG